MAVAVLDKEVLFGVFRVWELGGEAGKGREKWRG
jgi:hypothetical protein